MDSSASLALSALLAAIGITLSIASVGWCEFIDFTLPGDVSFSMGAWRYQSFALVGVSGSGIWKVDTCSSFPSDLSFDSNLNAARAFSILAPLAGIIAIIGSCRQARLGGALFLLAAMFQGLTLLILKSDICDAEKNPLFEGTLLANLVDDCELGSSAVIAIVATIFFVLAAIPTLLCRADHEPAIDSNLGKDTGDRGATAV